MINKELHGFTFKPSGSSAWSSQDNVINVSNEGVRDFINDVFLPSYNEKDISIGKECLEVMESVLKTDLDTNEPIVFFNAKDKLLRFYTKKGKVINSFPNELDNQVKNIDILTNSIKKLSDSISKVNVGSDDIEVLEHLNDSELMPVFNKLSSLGFLGSISINYTQNKKIDNFTVYSSDVSKRVSTKKKSLAMAWLNGVMSGVSKKMKIPVMVLEVANKILPIPTKVRMYTRGGILSFFTLASIKDGKKAAKEAKSQNKKIESLFYDIIEASQITPNEFRAKTDTLLMASTTLLKTIDSFTEVDSKYKKSNTKLTRDMLRNARILSSIGLKVLKVQRDFYKGLILDK